VDEVSEKALEGADILRVISMNGVGLDRIDVEAATRRGIVVTHTPGTNADSVADHTLALILAQARLIPHHDRSVRSGGWTRIAGRELKNRRLGIVGLGRIGKAVALRALAFGMQVQAYDPLLDQEFCSAHGIDIIDLKGILATSDVLTLHCPLTPDTKNLINASSITTMKRGAVLINTSRGELVDETALIEALASGHLGGAGLDVFTTEPPREGPLWKMKQVVLSPHLGGNTEEAILRTAHQSALNVVAVLRGGTADRIVNAEVLRR
jgi:D-3-phosphoglycerate dehydrogenase